MKNKLVILLVALSVASVTVAQAQQHIKTNNDIGLYGGFTQFDITTDNFITTSGQGWIGGLAASVALPHKWYNVSYTIQIAQNSMGIMAKPNLTSAQEEVDFNMITAQVAFLVHLKVIQEYLTIDVGPMIQYTGDLEVENERQGSYIIENYTRVTAKDIYKISPFNINGAVGVSAGFPSFKLRGQYIYGFTNILNQLNDEKFAGETNTSKFKGNQSMFALTAMIIF
ncbi:hypothetical protein [Gelidibacter salicanalis]|uniref:PorT family protein n=1 Tax=Gelidibacter salicanalis TaxID=291193 RepID=A0A934KQM1_9FLAO|nr:hypothetical protein [Gelidibacter salicanalis]MBJ7879656.1 hypothetical protein [Gelidibacter salicanalis]